MKRGLFSELRRRNVYRPAILYVGGVWALAQGISQLGPAFGLPDSATRWFVVAAAIGFPFWIAFAWIYELTPEGLKRERDLEPDKRVPRRTARKLDMAIIGVLSLAVVLLLANTFVRHKEGIGWNGAVRPGAATTASAKTIAVLPFANLSSDRQQEYFAEGIAEDLLNLLTRIPQLSVTARTSSFAFQGKGLGIPEIARRLHVAHILEGSVEKAGDEVRITAQLVDAGTDTQLWSQSWDRKLTDVFAIQDSIAADVVRNLEVKLLGAPPTAPPTDPRAYALYLQARQLAYQLTPAALQESDSLYRQALAIDPGYAPAWEKLASNAANEAVIGMLSTEGGAAQAREDDERALAIDPDYAAAYETLGFVAMFADNDLASAARYLERALALDPADPEVLDGSSTLLANLGRLDESLVLEKALVRRDPVDVPTLYNVGVSQMWAGRFDSAVASFHTALSLSPKRVAGHYLLGVTLLLKGGAPEALAQMKQEPNEAWRLIGLSMAYHALGREHDSDTTLAALIAKYGKGWPYNIASVYAFRGDADKAFEWLDKAVEYHDSGLDEIVPDNLFDRIHSDPRWVPFLRRLGMAPDQLAKIRFKVTLPGGSKVPGGAEEALLTGSSSAALLWRVAASAADGQNWRPRAVCPAGWGSLGPGRDSSQVVEYGGRQAARQDAAPPGTTFRMDHREGVLRDGKVGRSLT